MVILVRPMVDGGGLIYQPTVPSVMGGVVKLVYIALIKMLIILILTTMGVLYLTNPLLINLRWGTNNGGYQMEKGEQKFGKE